MKVDTITQCNKMFLEKTLHPLVSLIEMPDLRIQELLQMDFYSVLMKGRCSQSMTYGQKNYDFSDGTLVFLSPGQPINCMTWGGGKDHILLCFHPELISGTSLGEHFNDYTFFHYRQNEALHVSVRERMVFKDCMESIKNELRWGVDEYSRKLICNKIELLLNYGSRFYHRQFIMRHDVHAEIVEKTDKWLERYFFTGQPRHTGLPSAESCARVQNMSSAYFDDLLKFETGKRTDEYVQFKRISVACDLLRRTDRSVAEIAEDLGCPSVRHFTSLFKKLKGCTPSLYKTPN